MPVAAMTKIPSFIESVFEGQHNFASDEFKVFLSNQSPSVSNSIKSDILEITETGGYTAGGQVVPIVTSSQSGGNYAASVSSTLLWSASGAGFGPARYAYMYNNTNAQKRLVGVWDYGSTFSPSVGEQFQWVMNGNLIAAN